MGLVPLLLCLAAYGQSRAGRFQGRSAWVLENDRMKVTVLEWGGHVAEIVLRDGRANPLLVPARPTIDPDQYVPEKHEKLYGGGPGARLSSGQVGHILCFPFWGNPSRTEYAAGMTYHGEAGIAKWKREASEDDVLKLTVSLPESRTRFTRAVRLAGQVAWFDEAAENESTWDRPVSWCEHVTLGPPFLAREGTVFEASLADGEAYGHELKWPTGSDRQDKIDLRQVRAQNTRLVNHFLVDPKREWGYFTAFSPSMRLVFGYVFRRADFPWLNVWEANDGDLLARGMEFSNTPVHGTTRELVEHPQLLGRPTFEWLEARGRLTKRFAAFSIRVPEGFRGVADVLVGGDEVTIVERDSGRRWAAR